MNRAYSLIDIKSVKEDERVIEGIASTPSDRSRRRHRRVDGRQVQSADAAAVACTSTMQPIGHVEFAKPTKTGIPFKARIAKSDEPGTLKDRLDEAWQSIKLKLVRGGLDRLHRSRITRF